MFELKTFAPDANPLTLGVLVEADGVYPSESGGLAPVPGLLLGADALAAACQGAYNYRDLGGNFRTFAGTSTKLYQLVNDTWTDKSIAGNYSTTYQWHFASWGNWVIATCYSGHVPQVQKTSATTFANLGGSPPYAKFITTVQDFVMLAYYDDGTATANGVYWSAQGDAEDWTPATSTQCGYQALDDTPGPITGIGKIANVPIIFKERDFYVGTYVGPPFVWSFRRISGYGGSQASKAIVETEMGLFFLGYDDFYLFDGAVVNRIGRGVRRYFLNRMDRKYLQNCFAVYDPIRRLIFWWYPTHADGTGVCTECLIYDTKSGNWGRWEKSAETAFEQWKPSITYDLISTYYATYENITTYVPSYDAAFWSEQTYNLALIDSDHKLQRLEGTPGTNTFRSHWVGSHTGHTEIYQAWPNFATEPDSATVTPYTKDTLGGTASAGTSGTWSSGKVDLIANARFISLDFSISGDFDLVGIDVEGKQISRN